MIGYSLILSISPGLNCIYNCAAYKDWLSGIFDLVFASKVKSYYCQSTASYKIRRITLSKSLKFWWIVNKTKMLHNSQWKYIWMQGFLIKFH